MSILDVTLKTKEGSSLTHCLWRPKITMNPFPRIFLVTEAHREKLKYASWHSGSKVSYNKMYNLILPKHYPTKQSCWLENNREEDVANQLLQLLQVDNCYKQIWNAGYVQFSTLKGDPCFVSKPEGIIYAARDVQKYRVRQQLPAGKTRNVDDKSTILFMLSLLL